MVSDVISPVLADDTLQAWSVFAKAAERSEIRMDLTGKDNSNRNCWFNLETGEVGTQFNCTGRILALPDGWFRCSVVVTSSNGAQAPSIRIRMGVGDETDIYDGDGVSGLFLWGRMWETDQPTVSSYIKTEGVTVTRALDTFAGVFPHPPQPMTVYLKFSERGTGPLGGDTRVAQIGNLIAGGDPRLKISSPTNEGYQILHDNGVDSVFVDLQEESVVGDLVELAGRLFPDGSIEIEQQINRGPSEVSVRSGAVALAPEWAGQILNLNSVGSSNVGLNAFLAVKVHRGPRSLAFMRAL